MSVLFLTAGTSPLVNIDLGGALGDTVWGTTWFLLSVAVNVLVTALISSKIVREQKRLGRVLDTHRVRVYTDVVAILIESALPFTVLGIVAGVMHAVGYLNPDLSDALIEAWFAFCVSMVWHSASQKALLIKLVGTLTSTHYIPRYDWSCLVKRFGDLAVGLCSFAAYRVCERWRCLS
jgi:hypothetical protein